VIGSFRGIDHGHVTKVTRLHYADCSIIFSFTDHFSLLTVKQVLCCFELVSGLKVNF
jgi:hypothetical protein